MRKKRLTIDLYAPHQLYFNSQGVKLPSVTTIVGLAKPDLSWWHNRQGLMGVDTTVYVQRTADIGTIVHARIEAELRGMVLDESNLDPEIAEISKHGYVRFMNWWNDQDLDMRTTEQRMVSEKMQVGGTLDLVAERRIAPGHLLLIDIKSSAAVRRTMKIQVAGAYAPMYREVTGRSLAECWIVRTGRDVEDQIEIVRIDNRPHYEAAFRALVKAHSALGRLPEE